MQLISHKSQLLTLFYTIIVVTTIAVICAPTDAPESSELEKAGLVSGSQDTALAPLNHVAAAAPSTDSTALSDPATTTTNHHMSLEEKLELSFDFYYKFRNVVGEGVKKALDECRQKFKWDRWNCPLKSFKSIMDQKDPPIGPMPSNKELGLTRALISAGIVLSIVHSCSVGNSLCSCSNPITLPPHSAERFLADGVVLASHHTTSPSTSRTQAGGSMINSARVAGSFRASLPTNTPSINDHHGGNHHYSRHKQEDDQHFDENNPEPAHLGHQNVAILSNHYHEDNYQTPSRMNKFAWAGCDEVVKLGFKVAKAYLNVSDMYSPDASQLINGHNFEAGRQAVKRTMKRRCKCHGTSGACQINTCWTVVPDISEVGDYLKRQYRIAAKVGASTAQETDTTSLAKELSAIGPEKLVFADASPDYCYENKQLGINGTLGRYCSRTKHKSDGTEVSRSERDSCDRLCTKCGWKIKREKINVERQCDCRFVYCCSIECKRCPHVEETYKCVRHS